MEALYNLKRLSPPVIAMTGVLSMYGWGLWPGKISPARDRVPGSACAAAIDTYRPSAAARDTEFEVTSTEIGGLVMLNANLANNLTVDCVPRGSHGLQVTDYFCEKGPHDTTVKRKKIVRIARSFERFEKNEVLFRGPHTLPRSEACQGVRVSQPEQIDAG